MSAQPSGAHVRREYAVRGERISLKRAMAIAQIRLARKPRILGRSLQTFDNRQKLIEELHQEEMRRTRHLRRRPRKRRKKGSAQSGMARPKREAVLGSD